MERMTKEMKKTMKRTRMKKRTKKTRMKKWVAGKRDDEQEWVDDDALITILKHTLRRKLGSLASSMSKLKLTMKMKRRMRTKSTQKV
jgi:hypothetical protein